jgi:hypothetical protein
MTEQVANRWADVLRQDFEKGVFFGSANYHSCVAKWPQSRQRATNVPPANGSTVRSWLVHVATDTSLKGPVPPHDCEVHEPRLSPFGFC